MASITEMDIKVEDHAKSQVYIHMHTHGVIIYYETGMCMFKEILK